MSFARSKPLFDEMSFIVMTIICKHGIVHDISRYGAHEICELGVGEVLHFLVQSYRVLLQLFDHLNTKGCKQI